MLLTTVNVHFLFYDLMYKSYLSSTALIFFVQVIKIYMNWYKFSEYDSVNQFLLNRYHYIIILSIFENLSFAILLMMQIGSAKVISLEIIVLEDDNKFTIAWVYLFI
jgi:hypothetical protein